MRVVVAVAYPIALAAQRAGQAAMAAVGRVRCIPVLVFIPAVVQVEHLTRAVAVVVASHQPTLAAMAAPALLSLS
jgi:hypothetical protein